MQDFIYNTTNQDDVKISEEEIKIRPMTVEDFRLVLKNTNRTEANASTFQVKRIEKQDVYYDLEEEEEEGKKESSFVLGFKMGYEIANNNSVIKNLD